MLLLPKCQIQEDKMGGGGGWGGGGGVPAKRFDATSKAIRTDHPGAILDTNAYIIEKYVQLCT